MKEIKDNYVKILFSFFSNVLEEWTKETLWAQEIDRGKGLYKIDSIPFYAPFASGDVIFAEYDDLEKMLMYRDTIEFSGNSTIQVVLFNRSKEIRNVREEFADLGCISEQLNDRYFVIEIPAEKEYFPIKHRLTELQQTGLLDYAESCLANNHHY